jgi:hypothetical protein
MSRGEHVSQYKSAPASNRKFRFQAGTSGIYEITPLGISRLLVLSASANTLYSVYTSIKINRVQIWSAGNSGDLKMDPISLKYFSSSTNQAGAIRYTDYGNANHLAYISRVPDKDTLAHLWIDGTATLPLFEVGVNVGDIIDIDASIITDTETGAIGYTSTASSTPADFYTLALDNDGSNRLTPSENKTII